MNDMSAIPARAIWSADEMLECVSVIPEVPNTATFTFRAPSGTLFDFLPGQFLTLEIPAPGGTVHRTYTISSSPSRPRSISITAKAQADSIGTRWMLDNLAPGVRIKALRDALMSMAGSYLNTVRRSSRMLTQGLRALVCGCCRPNGEVNRSETRV